ncbi:MAG: hypothetical protein ACI841_004057, partial [Planctomycetota bacterium]
MGVPFGVPPFFMPLEWVGKGPRQTPAPGG